MPERLTGIVRQQILFGHIGNIFGFGVLGEQMVKGLILVWAHLRRNRLIPLLRVAEERIDIEHHAAKRIDAMPHDLADCVFGIADPVHVTISLRHHAPSNYAARIVALPRHSAECVFIWTNFVAVHDLLQITIGIIANHNWYNAAIAGSLAATSCARSTTTLACFQVASSCILPSIMTAPLPSGMAARIFFANATSAGSGEKTRLAISTWVGCNDQAPAQPIRNELRNCASQAA